MNKKKAIVKSHDSKIKNVNLYDYAKKLMMVYGTNINVLRAIPDVRDGLKPVERKLLYTMFKDKKMKPNAKKIKVNAITGTCMAEYYAHGEITLVDSLARLGQYWNQQTLLIDPQGNYGSISGDSHAAQRYIECGMAQFVVDVFFDDWFDGIVDMVPNYAGTTSEPEYLSSKIPFILTKGISGIGYTLATDIPMYNLGEVIDATIKLIKKPNSKVTLYPDSPIPCSLIDSSNWQEQSETGNGTYRMRASYKFNERENAIHIYELPYGVTINNINDTIIDNVQKGKLTGIADVLDVSTNRDNPTIDYKITIKNGYNPDTIMEELFKKTDLENTLKVNLEITYDYANYHWSLKAILSNWIEFRKNLKYRFYRNKYAKVKKEIHILEAILDIYGNNSVDKLIDMIRKCKNRKAVIEMLITKFNLTDVQATAIADMKVTQFAQENWGKFKTDYSEGIREEKHIKHMLHDEHAIEDEMIDEMLSIKRKYSTPRKARLIAPRDEEDVPDTEHLIVVTKDGYIKKLNSDTCSVGKISCKDFVTIKENNKNVLLLFDEKGKSFKLRVSDIDESGVESQGVLISNYIKTNNKIISVLGYKSKAEVDNSKKELFALSISTNGFIKKTELSEYSRANKSGIIGVGLKDSDKLINVIELKGHKDVIIYTNKGNYIKISSKEINKTGRNTMGVTAVNLKKDEKVIGMNVINKNNKYLVPVTDKGAGKKLLLKNLETSKRGTKSLPLCKDENIVGIVTADDSSVIPVYTLNGNIFEVKVSAIKQSTTISKCQKLVHIRRGDKVSDIG